MKKLGQVFKTILFKNFVCWHLRSSHQCLTVLSPWLLGLITSEVADAFKTIVRWDISISSGAFLYPLENLRLRLFHILTFLIFNYLQSFMLIGMTQNLTYQMRKGFII
jgi:hypothetical protein